MMTVTDLLQHHLKLLCRAQIALAAFFVLRAQRRRGRQAGIASPPSVTPSEQKLMQDDDLNDMPNKVRPFPVCLPMCSQSMQVRETLRDSWSAQHPKCRGREHALAPQRDALRAEA